MDKTLVFGLIALIVNFVGYVPYIRGIFTGHVRPQRITWGIWTILTTIAFINQVLNGGGYSTLFFGSTTLLVVAVFCLSLTHRGIGGASRFDHAILGASIVLFVFWGLAHETRLSTVLAVVIDGVGALPTVLKAFRAPHTELYLQWVLAAVAGLFALLAVAKADPILYLYPAYVIAMNAVIVAAKYFGTRRAGQN